MCRTVHSGALFTVQNHLQSHCLLHINIFFYVFLIISCKPDIVEKYFFNIFTNQPPCEVMFRMTCFDRWLDIYVGVERAIFLYITYSSKKFWHTLETKYKNDFFRSRSMSCCLGIGISSFSWIPITPSDGMGIIRSSQLSR